MEALTIYTLAVFKFQLLGLWLGLYWYFLSQFKTDLRTAPLMLKELRA